jgi:hypothetical protein
VTMRKTTSFLLSSVFALAIPLLPATARADLSACGNIHVEARAECDVVARGPSCDVECSELSYEASCHAEGYIGCEGKCSGSVEASCRAECDIGACEASCEVDPGEFDCQADCSLNCSADCSGECDAECGTNSECKASCKGSCEATCDGDCKGKCEATPPTATCKARCEASCEGECTAKSNLSCQVDCQNTLQVECEQELKGGCVAQCERGEVSVKCDDQYVDHGGNAEACLDAIAEWKEKLNFSATGSASCNGGSCKAEGEASASCALGRTGSSASLFLVAIVGAAGAIRRRRLRARV